MALMLLRRIIKKFLYQLLWVILLRNILRFLNQWSGSKSLKQLVIEELIGSIIRFISGPSSMHTKPWCFILSINSTIVLFTVSEYLATERIYLELEMKPHYNADIDGL